MQRSVWRKKTRTCRRVDEQQRYILRQWKHVLGTKIPVIKLHDICKTAKRTKTRDVYATTDDDDDDDDDDMSSFFKLQSSGLKPESMIQEESDSNEKKLYTKDEVHAEIKGRICKVLLSDITVDIKLKRIPYNINNIHVLGFPLLQSSSERNLCKRNPTSPTIETCNVPSFIETNVDNEQIKLRKNNGVKNEIDISTLNTGNNLAVKQSNRTLAINEKYVECDKNSDVNSSKIINYYHYRTPSSELNKIILKSEQSGIAKIFTGNCDSNIVISLHKKQTKVPEVEEFKQTALTNNTRWKIDPNNINEISCDDVGKKDHAISEYYQSKDTEKSEADKKKQSKDEILPLHSIKEQKEIHPNRRISKTPITCNYLNVKKKRHISPSTIKKRIERRNRRIQTTSSFATSSSSASSSTYSENSDSDSSRKSNLQESTKIEAQSKKFDICKWLENNLEQKKTNDIELNQMLSPNNNSSNNNTDSNNKNNIQSISEDSKTVEKSNTVSLAEKRPYEKLENLDHDNSVKKVKLNGSNFRDSQQSESTASNYLSLCDSPTLENIISPIDDESHTVTASVQSENNSIAKEVVSDSNILNTQRKEELTDFQTPKKPEENCNELDVANKEETPNQIKNSAENDKDSDNEDCLLIDAYNTLFDTDDEHDSENDKETKKTGSQSTSTSRYVMSDTAFKGYLNSNRVAFNSEYENISCTAKKNVYPIESQLQDEPCSSFSGSFGAGFSLGVNNDTYSDQNTMIRNSNVYTTKQIFLGYCYTYLQFGICHKSICAFNHNIKDLISKIKSQPRMKFISTIRCAASSDFVYIIKIILCDILKEQSANNIKTILTILFRFDHCIDKDMINAVIVELLKKGETLTQIALYFAHNVINERERQTVFTVLKSHVASGDLWDTTKGLVMRMSSASIHIIEFILTDCVEFRQEQAEDIQKNFISMQKPFALQTIDRNLLLKFKNILNNRIPQKDGLVPNIKNRSIQEHMISSAITSPQCNIPNNFLQEKSISSTVTSVQIYKPRILQKDVACVEDKNNNNKNFKNQVPFTLRPIDNLPEPASVFRIRFKDFYETLEHLRKELELKNYHKVLEILKNAEPIQNPSLYTTSCYKILCQEIRRSVEHLNNIILLSVREGVSATIRQILADLGKYILIHLINEGLHYLAYQLLVSLKDYYKQFDIKYNAAFLLLIAEIYIANEKPLEAFNILKQHKLLYTDRNVWTVPSNAEDEDLRVNLISLLLNILSTSYPEYATFVLKLILNDQDSNFYPIDITQHIDKMIRYLLIMKRMELLAEAGELVIKFCIHLAPITYRALIATLVSQNKILASQLYAQAINFGIYSSPKFKPVVNLHINSDHSYEEMYLALTQFIDAIRFGIGEGLDHVRVAGCFRLQVFIVIEITKDEKRTNTRVIYKTCKELIQDILQSRYDPPLKLQIRRPQRILKINVCSLINYFKAGHIESL